MIPLAISSSVRLILVLYSLISSTCINAPPYSRSLKYFLTISSLDCGIFCFFNLEYAFCLYCPDTALISCLVPRFAGMLLDFVRLPDSPFLLPVKLPSFPLSSGTQTCSALSDAPFRSSPFLPPVFHPLPTLVPFLPWLPPFPLPAFLPEPA